MKIKGHTDIILTDIKTGRKEVHSDDNMITNALTEFLQNCGLHNYPSLDRDTLIETLLGGIMAFSEPITEQAATVTLPAGNSMTANGSYMVDNDGTPEELGSYSDNESGRQSDRSFVQTYDFSSTQGNGTISCVCLTGKDFGYCGIGNPSGEAHETKRSITDLKGNIYTYQVPEGVMCHVDVVHSVCYTVDFSDLVNGNLTLRKYRLATEDVNLYGTTTELYKISETTITAPAHMVSANESIMTADNYSKLMVWNCVPSGSSATWGNGHTQYLWELDPVAGTVTEYTLLNTSGETLKELFNPFFTGDKIVWVDGRVYSGSYWSVDASYIYVMNRTSGVISKIENPWGTLAGAGNSWKGAAQAAGWNQCYDAGNGVVIAGTNSIILALDTTEGTLRITNGNTMLPFNNYEAVLAPTGSPLIGAEYNAGLLYLYRKQCYIASINNLQTPIVKDATKTMKIVYRITFEES